MDDDEIVQDYSMEIHTLFLDKTVHAHTQEGSNPVRHTLQTSLKEIHKYAELVIFFWLYEFFLLFF